MQLIKSATSEMIKLVNVLDNESDRGLILVGAAFLDDALKNLLESNFIDKPKIVKTLVDPDRPLGSFSSHIKAAYLLGLLDEAEFRDLELIRKIRNDVAHSHNIVAFDVSPNKDRIAELEGPKLPKALMEKVKTKQFTEKGKTPRSQLIFGISVLCAFLTNRTLNAKNPTVPDYTDLKNTVWTSSDWVKEDG